MRKCENCGATVDPRWKYCLNCGIRMPVETSVQQNAPTGSPAEAASALRAARRRGTKAELREFDAPWEDSVGGDHQGERRFRFDWQLALGIVLALGGVGMIAYLVVGLILK